MTPVTGPMGIGIGWRTEIALWIDRRPNLRFVEVMLEDFDTCRPLPVAIQRLLDRGVTIAPHSVSLSLGGAEPPDIDVVRRLGDLARQLGSPCVSDHVAFVRARGVESGHLLPVVRTDEALDVLVENIRTAQRHLPVPLAVENIASLFEWPQAEMDEGTFLREVLSRTSARLLLDVANLYANSRNHGWDPIDFLDTIPLNRIAYVHIAGGVDRDGIYHDTHSHPLRSGPLKLLSELCARTVPPGVLIEQDDDFPGAVALERELQAIGNAAESGAARRDT
jgi:uncharacterized protein